MLYNNSILVAYSNGDGSVHSNGKCYTKKNGIYRSFKDFKTRKFRREPTAKALVIKAKSKERE